MDEENVLHVEICQHANRYYLLHYLNCLDTFRRQAHVNVLFDFQLESFLFIIITITFITLKETRVFNPFFL